jgi:hypothetical protein
MRVGRLHQGNKGIGRHSRIERVVVHPIAVSGATFNDLSKVNYNNIVPWEQPSFDKDQLTSLQIGKWFFGNLQSGPQDISRITICLRANITKSGDTGTVSFVIGGISTTCPNMIAEAMTLVWPWKTTNLYGSWSLRDFSSNAATGPYIQIAAALNAKPLNVFELQLHLFGR